MGPRLRPIRVIAVALITALAGAAAGSAFVIIEPLGANSCIVSIQGEQALRLADYGGFSAGTRAEIVVNRLQNLMEFGEINSISLDFTGDDPVLRTNLGILVTADSNSAVAEGIMDKYELAKLWKARLAQTLRISIASGPSPEGHRPYERREAAAPAVPSAEGANRGQKEPPVALAKPDRPQAQPIEPRPQQAQPQQGDGVIEGTASWYGPGFHGRRTASGEVYNQNLLTAAHRSLPFGTRLLVKDHVTGKTVIVVVNDRGPFIKNRVLDLSYGAAQQLNMVDRGVAKVTATILTR